MKTYHPQPARSARASRPATAFPGAFGIETLESRQLMSVAPGVGSIGQVAALQNPVVSMPKSPAGATGAKTAVAVRTAAVAAPGADAQATAVVKTAVAKSAGETPTTPPPAGNGTATTRSLWGKIKAAAKWAKNHIVIGLNKIGIKGTF